MNKKNIHKSQPNAIFWSFKTYVPFHTPISICKPPTVSETINSESQRQLEKKMFYYQHDRTIRNTCYTFSSPPLKKKILFKGGGGEFILSHLLVRYVTSVAPLTPMSPRRRIGEHQSRHRIETSVIGWSETSCVICAYWIFF